MPFDGLPFGVAQRRVDSTRRAPPRSRYRAAGRRSTGGGARPGRPRLDRRSRMLRSFSSPVKGRPFRRTGRVPPSRRCRSVAAHKQRVDAEFPGRGRHMDCHRCYGSSWRHNRVIRRGVVAHRSGRAPRAPRPRSRARQRTGGCQARQPSTDDDNPLAARRRAWHSLQVRSISEEVFHPNAFHPRVVALGQMIIATLSSTRASRLGCEARGHGRGRRRQARRSPMPRMKGYGNRSLENAYESGVGAGNDAVLRHSKATPLPSSFGKGYLLPL